MMNFETYLNELKEKWYYIIRTDDWDRYLWEVYRKNELERVVGSENEAYFRLWEYVQWDLNLPF